MKIREVIVENGTGSLAPAVARTLPSTYVLPHLKNQDPYLQYRMGMALAAARHPENWENMSVVGYTDADDETLKLALKLIGPEYAAGAKLISTKKSEEATDVNKTSPMQAQGPIKRRG